MWNPRESISIIANSANESGRRPTTPTAKDPCTRRGTPAEMLARARPCGDGAKKRKRRRPLCGRRREKEGNNQATTGHAERKTDDRGEPAAAKQITKSTSTRLG